MPFFTPGLPLSFSNSSAWPSTSIISSNRFELTLLLNLAEFEKKRQGFEAMKVYRRPSQTSPTPYFAFFVSTSPHHDDCVAFVKVSFDPYPPRPCAFSLVRFPSYYPHSAPFCPCSDDATCTRTYACVTYAHSKQVRLLIIAS